MPNWPDLQAIGIAMLMVAGLLLRISGIYVTSQTSTIGSPLSDDSYYYFSLGRNLADGPGPYVDALHTTTGFQPLWGALVALAFAVAGNGSIAISITQAIGALAGLLTAGLLYAFVLDLSGSPKLSLLMAAWWLLSPQAITYGLNGMETSVAVCSVVAVFYSLRWLLTGDSVTSGLITGFLCGIAILSRVDSLILLGCVSFVLLGQWIGVHGLLSERGRIQLKQLAAVWLGSILPLVPWFWFALTLGRSVIPESGSAVYVLTLLGNELPFYSVTEALWHQPTLFLRFYVEQLLIFTATLARQSSVLLPVTLPLFALNNVVLRLIIEALIVVSTGIGLVVLTFRTNSEYKRGVMAVWALYAIGMALAYSIFVLGAWFYARYVASLEVLLSALTLSILLRSLASLPEKRYSKLVRVLAHRAVLFYCITSAAFLIVLYSFGSYRWLLSGSLALPDDGFYRSAQLMNEDLPSTARVGAFQSGLIGYYARPLVINLDGKVNANARLALKNGTMWRYICDAQIEYIVDWPSLVEHYLVKRSSVSWQDDNLSVLHQVRNDFGVINIYEVNRANCLQR